MNSILIVDDERGIRETLRGGLEDEGFEVENNVPKGAKFIVELPVNS